MTRSQHPWATLDASLHTIRDAADRRSPAYREAVCAVSTAVEQAAWRLVRSPRFRWAAWDGRDLAQAWWSSMLQVGFSQYRESRSPLYVYSYAVLCHLFRDMVRRARVRRGKPLPSVLTAEAPAPSALVVAAEERARLRDAVDRLPESLRVVIEMRYFEGHSPSETALRCKTRPALVNRRAFVARRRLRRLLGD